MLAFNKSVVMAVLVTYVTANNGFPRSIILLELAYSEDFDFHNFSSPGFLMQKTELRKPLQSNSSLFLFFGHDVARYAMKHEN